VEGLSVTLFGNICDVIRVVISIVLRRRVIHYSLEVCQSYSHNISMVVLTIAFIPLLVGGGISLSVFFVSKHATSVMSVHVVKEKKVVMGGSVATGVFRASAVV
jgi:hypothetical protein